MQKKMMKKNGHSPKRSGFTLIELLISLFLIAAVGMVVVSIFFSALRGTAKSTAQTSVRQNGNAMLLQILRLVRNAKSFDGVSVDGVSDFTTSCTTDVVGALTPTPGPESYAAIKVTSFDSGSVVIKCPTADETSITSNDATLADTSSTTSPVVVESCSFSCTQASVTDMPVIGISFTVKSTTLPGSADRPISQLFQSTVVPRNITR